MANQLRMGLIESKSNCTFAILNHFPRSFFILDKLSHLAAVEASWYAFNDLQSPASS